MKDTIPSCYYRSLDLQNATSLVKYTVGNITYTRETFISHPAKIMMVRITANKKASINIQTTLTSKLKYHVNAVSDNYLVLKGKAPKYVANREYDPHQVVYDENANGEGMNFEVHVKLLAVNGTVKQLAGALNVRNADEVVIYLSEATSFNGFNKSGKLRKKEEAVCGILPEYFDSPHHEHFLHWRRVFCRSNLDAFNLSGELSDFLF